MAISYCWQVCICRLFSPGVFVGPRQAPRAESPGDEVRVVTEDYVEWVVDDGQHLAPGPAAPPLHHLPPDRGRPNSAEILGQR